MSFIQQLNRLLGYQVVHVRPCDEADTSVVQHDFMHLSFFQDDLMDFDSAYAAWWFGGSRRGQLLKVLYYTSARKGYRA
jgi:hypothetical protein